MASLMIAGTLKFQQRLEEGRATDGARTRDNLNHNQGLYQLSYGRRCRSEMVTPQRWGSTEKFPFRPA